MDQKPSADQRLRSTRPTAYFSFEYPLRFQAYPGAETYDSRPLVSIPTRQGLAGASAVGYVRGIAHGSGKLNDKESRVR